MDELKIEITKLQQSEISLKQRQKDLQSKLINMEDDIVQLLTTDFSGDPVILQQALEKMVSYSYTIGDLKIKANNLLACFQLLNHVFKSKDLSEADRKLVIDIKCMEQNNLVDKLKLIEEKIDKKISIGQSILKYETQRMMKSDLK